MVSRQNRQKVEHRPTGGSNTPVSVGVSGNHRRRTVFTKKKKKKNRVVVVEFRDDNCVKVKSIDPPQVGYSVACTIFTYRTNTAIAGVEWIGRAAVFCK